MRFLETLEPGTASDLEGGSARRHGLGLGEEQGLGKDWEELSVSWGSALGYPLLDVLYMTQSRAVAAGQGAHLPLWASGSFSEKRGWEYCRLYIDHVYKVLGRMIGYVYVN